MQYLNTFRKVVRIMRHWNQKPVDLSGVDFERLRDEYTKNLRVSVLDGDGKNLRVSLRDLGVEQILLLVRDGDVDIDELDKLSNLMKQKFSAEIKQKSHIKGWLFNTLLEEWRGELEALRCGWLEKGKPELWIKIMTGFYLLGLLKAYLQIKVENRWLPNKKQS